MKAWLASIPKKRIIVLICVISLAVLCLSFLCHQAWEYWVSLGKIQEPKDQFMAKNDFIKTVAQVLGGAFFLFTIYFTYQNLLVSQKSLRETQEKNKADLAQTQEKSKADLDIARDQQTTELYVKAIEQLGSDKMEVRLGGIYALERIARTSPKDHWTIMEVLTAFVREKAPAIVTSESTPSTEISPYFYIGKNKPRPKADIQAVLTVLGRTAMSLVTVLEGETRRLNLQRTNLQGADLDRANFQDAWLVEAQLQGAELRGANLQGAVLRGAALQGAELWDGTNLEGADLWGADLRLTDFRGDLTGFFGESIRTQGAYGLTFDQIERANGWESAKLPDNFPWREGYRRPGHEEG
jgi:hypothetical protein